MSAVGDARKRQAEQETPIPIGDAALCAYVRALEAELAQVKADLDYTYGVTRKAIHRAVKAEAERDRLREGIEALAERVVDARQSVTEGSLIGRIKVHGWLRTLLADHTNEGTES